MKKIFSMLMAITISVCAVGSIPISAHADEQKYDELNISPEYGDFEMSYDKNTRTFTIENKIHTDIQAILYTAVYSAVGQPRFFFRQEINIPAEGYEKSFVPLSYSTFFLWDENMKPLADKIKVGDMTDLLFTDTTAKGMSGDEYVNTRIKAILHNQRFDDDYELLFGVRKDNDEKILEMLSEYITPEDKVMTTELYVYKNKQKVDFPLDEPHTIQFMKELPGGSNISDQGWGSNYRFFLIDGETYNQLEVSGSSWTGFYINSDTLGTFVIVYKPQE